MVSSGEFTVLKISKISDYMISSFELRGKFYFNLKNKLVDEGIVVNDIFEKDYEFKDTSAASAVILSRKNNSNLDWGFWYVKIIEQ